MTEAPLDLARLQSFLDELQKLKEASRKAWITLSLEEIRRQENKPILWRLLREGVEWAAKQNEPYHLGKAEAFIRAWFSGLDLVTEDLITCEPLKTAVAVNREEVVYIILEACTIVEDTLDKWFRTDEYYDLSDLWFA